MPGGGGGDERRAGDESEDAKAGASAGFSPMMNLLTKRGLFTAAPAEGGFGRRWRTDCVLRTSTAGPEEEEAIMKAGS